MDNNGKKILDVTCGSRTIWFDKENENALYCDIRREQYSGIWTSTVRDSERMCVIDPDLIADFRDLPFDNDSFYLVVFDPPHMLHVGDNAWMRKKYGKLGDTWREDLRRGFDECMRVLRPNGVLIFKWSEIDVPVSEIIDTVGVQPLFGHKSGKQMHTHWLCFMKLK